MQTRPDPGSLPLAMLITLVTMILGAFSLPVVVTQATSTRTTQNRITAYQAARSGLESTLGRIRATYRPGTGGSDRAALPCAVAGDLILGGARTASWSVRVDYYAADLTDPPAAIAASKLTSATGTTPGQAQSGSLTPAFARLVSRAAVLAGGTATEVAGGSRTLQADYVLNYSPDPVAGPSTTPAPSASAAPANTPGPTFASRNNPRQIITYASTQAKCVSTDSSKPVAGTPVKLRTCDGWDTTQGNDYPLFFYYRADASFATSASLLSSDTDMCIDGGASIAGTTITVQPCVSPTPARQRWYYDRNQNIQLAKDGTAKPNGDPYVLSGLCFNVVNPDTNGSTVRLGTQCGTGWNTTKTFMLDGYVGAGQAPRSRAVTCTDNAAQQCLQGQVVNKLAASRCLDVEPNGGATPFVTLMTCEQNPDPAAIDAEQVWQVPLPSGSAAVATGRPVTMGANGVKYCMAPYQPDLNDSQLRQTPRLVRQTCDGNSLTFTVYGLTTSKWTSYHAKTKIGGTDYCLTQPIGNDANWEIKRFWWNPASYEWRASLMRCVTSDSDPLMQDQYNYGTALDRQQFNVPWGSPAAAGPSTPASATPTAAPVTPTVAPVPTVSAQLYPLRNLVEIR